MVSILTKRNTTLRMRFPIALAVAIFIAAAPVQSDDTNDEKGKKPPPKMPPNFENMFNQQNCKNFHCTSGYTPVPKSRVKFESAGCSSMTGGSMLQVVNAPGGNDGKEVYESCCDAWNACYQICGMSKAACDEEFKSCSTKMCESLPDDDGTPPTDDGKDGETTKGTSSSRDECNKFASLASMMSSINGCGKYDQAQYKACDCVAKDKASDRREASVRYFYKTHAPDNVSKVKQLMKKVDTTSKMAGLLRKLVAKYPEAIKKVEDPQQKMYQTMFQETAKKQDEKSENDDNDVSNDDEADEKIEL